MNRLTAALALALAGCATQPIGYWFHPQHGTERLQQDMAECRYQAASATAGAPAYLSLSRQMAQDVETGMRQGELFHLCMEAKQNIWVSR